MMECPYCKEEVKDNAIKCKHCSEWLDGRPSTAIGELKERSVSSSLKLKNNITDTYQSVFGSSKFYSPTNAKPLKVNDDLILYGDHFIDRKHKVLYSEIEGMRFDSYSGTFNFINTQDVTLSVHYHSRYGGGAIFLSSSTMFVRLKKFKLIQHANLVFASKSYQARLKSYLNELHKYGHIKYKGGTILKKQDVKIHKDGLLKVDNKSINIKEALKSGTLGLEGMSGKSLNGLSHSFDPLTIGASMGSGGVFSDKVLFKAEYNFDVIKEVLYMIAYDQIITPTWKTK